MLPQAAVDAAAGIPGWARPAHLPELRRLDFELTGPGVPSKLPPAWGEPYPWYVSALDSDGNEVAGIRHPDLAVPLATYAGYNVRHADAGAPGEVVPMAGATYPFPRTGAERTDAGDPRPPIAERYANRQAYLAQVRAAAEALVAERLLLDEDVERMVAEAGVKYDAFTA